MKQKRSLIKEYGVRKNYIKQKWKDFKYVIVSKARTVCFCIHI